MKQARTKDKKIRASIRGYISFDIERGRVSNKAQEIGHRKPYSTETLSPKDQVSKVEKKEGKDEQSGS